MKENVKYSCDLLVSNKNIVESEFRWDNAIMTIASELVFSCEGKEADPAKLKVCKDILDKKMSFFSSFRSTARSLVVTKMALSEDPERYLTEVREAYDRLSKVLSIFTESTYVVHAAVMIVDSGKYPELDVIVPRFKEIYTRMGQVHPLLTASEDIVYAVLLAMSGKDVDTIIRDMEECYNYIKKEKAIYLGSNEIQGVSEVLALSDGDMKARCDQVVDLYNTFAAHGEKYGREYNEFASLATLIDLDVDRDALVEEIIETAAYLKSNRGFGSWSLGTKQRLMFAAMLVGNAYDRSAHFLENSTINSTIAAIIAEEVALMVVIMSMSTTTTVATATY